MRKNAQPVYAYRRTGTNLWGEGKVGGGGGGGGGGATKTCPTETESPRLLLSYIIDLIRVHKGLENIIYTEYGIL